MNLFTWMSPQQIYQDLTGGPGSDTLSAAQRMSNDETEREFVRAARVQRMGKTIYGGWEGSAADAASGAASPLMRAASEGSQHLYRAQDLLSRQSGSFHEAANSVVPVPEKPPEVGMLDEMLPTESDTEKAVKQYQADAHNNIQVFQGYDNASIYNEDMPRDYTLTNHSGGSLSVTDGGDGGAVDSDDDQPPRGPGNYSAPGGGDVGGPSSPGPGGGPLPGGGSPGSQTNPSEYRPSPGPGHSPGGYPESPAAHQPTSGGPGFVPGTVGGYPGGSGGGSGGGWRGGGSGGSGGGGGGAGAGGPGASGRAPGPSAGIGALAAAEEAAARRGAAGAAAARGGMGPMGAPMAGAGRGRDEDEEHTRKVLIEADAEGTFGSDVLTAPPVIGDEEDDD